MAESSDQDRFADLIDKHKGIIYKICSSYCRSGEDRKDLAQEIILQLLRSFPRYDETKGFSTWMYRIALNVAISDYRKGSRQKSVLVSWPEHLIDFEEDKEETELRENRIQRLYQFIDQLDKLNKALMILYLDGNSYQKIAEILGISESLVGTRLNRAKQKMKKYFTTFQH